MYNLTIFSRTLMVSAMVASLCTTKVGDLDKTTFLVIVVDHVYW